MKKHQSMSLVQCTASGAAAQGTYRAAVCTELGKPLQVQSLPRKPVGTKEVRIKIIYAGLNFGEMLMIQGKYQERAPLPFIPGSELSGEVVELGKDVQHHLSIGDKVRMGIGSPPILGSYAEEIVVPAAAVTKTPENIQHMMAASFAGTYVTAWLALKHRINIKEGDTVLVTAAAGGVGLATVDLATKIFKCKVIGACGGPAKCALVKEKGCVAAIDYNKESIRDRMKELTDGRGADVIVENVGGKVLAECLRSIAFEGSILIIGFTSGDIPKIPANILMLKSISAVGVHGGLHATRDPEVFADCTDSCVKLLAEEQIKPHVSSVFPLSQVNEALAFLASRKSTGKVLIDCQNRE